MNTNGGVLLIGVKDGKNTESGKPEAATERIILEVVQDKYSRIIEDTIKDTFGVTTSDLIRRI